MSRPAERLERYTYADYAGWPEDVRGELIGGVFYAMTAPLTRHQRLSIRLAAQFVNQLRGRRCQPFVAPTDVLFVKPGTSDEDNDDVVQPDLFIVCQPDRIQPRYIRGAPDFVLEILSPSTALQDQVRKLRLYEREGVSEYWMIDPETRVLHLYRREADGPYGRPDVLVAEGSTPLRSVEDVTVNWDEAFAE